MFLATTSMPKAVYMWVIVAISHSLVLKDVFIHSLIYSIHIYGLPSVLDTVDRQYYTRVL